MDDITTLRELHASRKREELLKSELDIANEFLQQSPSYKNAQDIAARIKEEQARQKQLRSDVVGVALFAYLADKSNKNPLPGVNIKVGRAVTYDRAVARTWCLHNLTTALTLDERSFESSMRLIAKDNAPVSPLPDFVKVEDEASVMIASDLGKHLIVSNQEDASYPGMTAVEALRALYLQRNPMAEEIGLHKTEEV